MLNATYNSGYISISSAKPLFYRLKADKPSFLGIIYGITLTLEKWYFPFRTNKQNKAWK
ncbi:MAG: hypothetical protein ACO1NX_11205 [Chitinophagaceae bacterium]